ncbi:MAG: TlpA family protein disulfide reductase [Burkholderiales bacterium]|nr:TlpA family protein disulfide reductase [Burkholderiales bacterium]
MPTRRRWLAGAALLALAGPAAASWNRGEAVTLPALTLLDGSALDTSSLRGKVVLLQFWASWCPFCARQNPLIEALHRAHRARGLEVVTVSIDRTPAAAADYMRAKGYSFRAGMINPAYERIYRLRRGLPQVYVIGRDGRVALIELGEMLEDEVGDIARLL